MSRYYFAALLSAAALLNSDLPKASAQPQMPQSPVRPAFNPYLSLLGNPGLNYYSVVRPQLQLQQQMSTMQQQMLTGQGQGQGGAADPSTMLPPTGTVSMFNTGMGSFDRIPIGTGVIGGGAGGGSASFNSTGGGSRNLIVAPSFSTGGAAAAGFQRNNSMGGGMQPSFATPTKIGGGTMPPAPKR